MAVVDRRKFVFAALGGAGAALALAPSAAAAAFPLGAGETGRLVDPLEDEVKPAQVVVAPGAAGGAGSAGGIADAASAAGAGSDADKRSSRDPSSIARAGDLGGGRVLRSIVAATAGGAPGRGPEFAGPDIVCSAGQ